MASFWGGREIDRWTKHRASKVPSEILACKQIQIPKDGNSTPLQPPLASRWPPADIDFANATTTIMAPSVAGRGHWGRDVLIVCLPQLFVHLMHTQTAEEILESGLQSPVVVYAHKRCGAATRARPTSSQPTATQASIQDHEITITTARASF